MTNDEIETLRACATYISALPCGKRASEMLEVGAVEIERLQRANAELTARAEKAEKESERLMALLAIGGAVGCLDRRREECEGCDDYDTCTASSAKWPKTPRQAKDEQ